MRRWFAFGLILFACAANASDFSFKDTQGRQQRLTDYRGKWVLVNFWATWCPPCQAEIPELIALHNAHKDRDLVVIGVLLDYYSAKAALDYAASRGVTYPLVLGNYKMAVPMGGVEVLPTTYLYDPTGKLVSYQAGAITRESVETYIRLKSAKGGSDAK